MKQKNPENTGNWKTLKAANLGTLAAMWISTLDEQNTKLCYENHLARLFSLRLVTKSMSISDFTKINSNKIVDRIKNQRKLAEPTKQARAACFITFIKYLSRLTNGRVKPALAVKHGTAKTFYAVRDKVKTKAINKEEYLLFRKELEKISKQHRIISDIILQGVKRISEVLNLKIEDIDFETRKISFKQSKTRGKDKHTIITYPEQTINELKELISDREKGFVFIRNRNKIPRHRFNISFAQAGIAAKIENKVTPHVLRATGTTLLKGMGYSNDAIAKMSGTTPMQVSKYDKTDIADNPSALENLIQ